MDRLLVSMEDREKGSTERVVAQGRHVETLLRGVQTGFQLGLVAGVGHAVDVRQRALAPPPALEWARKV